MNKTKIEWCDYTWNPVTGCLNNCYYCYARKIGMRFQGHFKPMFHKDRLQQPYKEKNPSKIFVCSMADLFGEWSDKKWIDEVIQVAKDNPRHTFQFLTKNPSRYTNFWFPENCWLGETLTGGYIRIELPLFNKRFISIEPLLEKPQLAFSTKHFISWIVVGGLTPKPVHKKEWIDEIVYGCKNNNIPIFIKDNCKYDKVIKEFPEENLI